MALNPSIIQGLKQFQIDSPDESLVKSLTIKDLMRKSQESEFAAQDAQTARRDKITMNELYQSALGANGKLDRNALLTGAAQRGLGSQIPGLQKNFAADDKAQGELSETAAKTSKIRSEALKMTLERSRDSLNTINDPIAAEQWVRANYANPELAEVTKHGNVDQAVAGIPKDQAGFQQWKLQSGLSAEKMIQFTTPDANAQLSARTSTANNAATVANSASNAALTNARTRDFNDTKVEDNRIKREAKDDANTLTKSSQLASFDTMLGTLDRLAAHPGLSRSVGVTGMLPTMPGSNSANFQAELNTFQSQAFIPMVAQLKGMGALSDAEGKKLTAAVGALDPKMGETAFRDSVERITTDMQAARQRMAGANKGNASAGQDGAVSKSKSGKDIVMRNGQWEYK